MSKRKKKTTSPKATYRKTTGPRTSNQGNNGRPPSRVGSSSAGSLREAILDDFSALRIPISDEALDGALREAEGASSKFDRLGDQHRLRIVGRVPG
jgi:hypothetical protein